ncbi:MAG: patatin-like phospholipase family protein [Bdellovibrionales bacterium]|jgi:NTE family protein|nr:patatin-like phospholipase family protein [Bdellovibrionales bacterium]
MTPSTSHLTDSHPITRLGLVLSGGGARGAYQAGVLLGISEIAAAAGISHPFKIVTGVSAGAVNAAFLASRREAWVDVTRTLADVWGDLTVDRVFKTDAVTAGRLGMRFLFDTAIGSMSKKKRTRSILDTSPLSEYLADRIRFSDIPKALSPDGVESVAISAMNYTNAHSITFVQSCRKIEMWNRSRRRGIETPIGVEHVMGSSAIPLVFPPVRVGDDHFGDGSLRNTAPLSPAIHLGADRLLVISVRRPDHLRPKIEGHIEPSLARVAGVVLNSLLMDAIEFDMERLGRINQTIDLMPQEARERLNLRKVEYLWIRPSEDIGAIARGLFHKLPNVIRYLVAGLGSPQEAAELTSYLLFDKEFCGALTTLGRQNAYENRAEIERFLGITGNR